MNAASGPTSNGRRAKVGDRAQAVFLSRTLRMRVKRDAYSWLNGAAAEVNLVWN